MAVSETSICNLALQRLGAKRVTDLGEDSPNGRSCNAAYTHVRDRELRAHVWNFVKKRATLVAHATEPDDDSGFAYAYPLPADYLRLLPQNESNLFAGDNGVDWKIENHEGVRCLMTSESSPHIVYLARITDPTLFDVTFVDALALKLAWHMCEEITQSNTKKKFIEQEYRDAVREARRMNAFESLPAKPAEDSWVSVRR